MDSIKALMSIIDTIHMGFYPSEFKLTEDDFKYLEEQKQLSKESGFSGNDLIEFKGKYWHITSARKIYAYVLYNDDATIKIARKLSGGAYPEIFVEFRSRLLLGGLTDAYLIIREWIEKWAVISSEKVSRADLTTDFQGDLRLDMDNVVMRCRKNDTNFESLHREGRRITGYTFGSGELMLRIYDKTQELKKKGKQYILAEWEKHGWDKESEVWRVEYQMRREVLKQFKIETLQDLRTKAPDMWNYLTKEWFTVRQPSVTDSTRSRWSYTELWETVQESFKSFGELSGVVREKIKQVTLEKLVPQMSGLVTSCMALMVKKRIDIRELLKIIENDCDRKGKTIETVVRSKLRRYALFEESYFEAI